MAIVELNAKKRKNVGKGSSRKTRSEGFVPAVLYGEGEESQPLAVSSKEFYPVIHTAAGENVVLDLKIDGAGNKECKAIIKEIQYHPVRREILHVDFQHISLTKEITVRVPVEATGEAVGVKTKGGILELIHREVEVRCLPTSIPDVISVDVSGLDVGDSLQVGDLRVAGATIISDPEEVVITIVAPTVIEEPKPEVAEEEEKVEAEEAAEEGEEKPADKKPKEPEEKAEK
jgi:large subunit ribosomal protein L25